MWHAQSLFGMSLRSMISFVLGQHYTRLQTPRDFWSISLVFLITYNRRMSIYSLPKHTIKWWWVLRGHNDCIQMLLKTSKTQIQIMREKHNLIFVIWFKCLCYGKETLASTMRTGLCHAHLNALNFFEDNYLQDLPICAPLAVLHTTFVSVVCVLALPRMKPICASEGASPKALEIGH